MAAGLGEVRESTGKASLWSRQHRAQPFPRPLGQRQELVSPAPQGRGVEVRDAGWSWPLVFMATNALQASC